MSHYAKYNVTVSFLGKTFNVRGVTAFNEDNARKQVKDLLKFERVEKSVSKPNSASNPFDMLNEIFGL